MPPSFPVLADTTTQSPWLRAWTAACLVLQDTTVRRRGWPKCLGNARLVSNSAFVYFFQRHNHIHTAWFLRVRTLSSAPAFIVSRGRQASLKQSKRLAGREQRVHIKHETSQFNTSQSFYFSSLYSFIPAFQQQQQLLDNPLYIIYLCTKAPNSLAPYANYLMHAHDSGRY